MFVVFVGNKTYFFLTTVYITDGLPSTRILLDVNVHIKIFFL